MRIYIYIRVYVIIQQTIARSFFCLNIATQWRSGFFLMEILKFSQKVKVLCKFDRISRELNFLKNRSIIFGNARFVKQHLYYTSLRKIIFRQNYRNDTSFFREVVVGLVVGTGVPPPRY